MKLIFPLPTLNSYAILRFLKVSDSCSNSTSDQMESGSFMGEGAVLFGL
jgi:hypothetical protein